MDRHALIEELVTANHILANENVLDSFGHVSIRNPDNPDRFFCRERERLQSSKLRTSWSSHLKE